MLVASVLAAKCVGRSYRLRLSVAPGVAAACRIILAAFPWVRSVRHSVIPVALMLGACSLPGASDMPNLMHLQPTQEFCASQKLTLDSTTKQCVMTQELCASRGLTLDATLGQCVTPKSSPPPPPQVVQVQPPPAPPARAQQHQRADPLVQIEPDAAIYPELKQDVAQMDELAHFVRASGYRCDSISAVRPLPTSNGFKLACNHSIYKYEIEDKGGSSIVTVE